MQNAVFMSYNNTAPLHPLCSDCEIVIAMCFQTATATTPGEQELDFEVSCVLSAASVRAVIGFLGAQNYVVLAAVKLNAATVQKLV